MLELRIEAVYSEERKNYSKIQLNYLQEEPNERGHRRNGIRRRRPSRGVPPTAEHAFESRVWWVTISPFGSFEADFGGELDVTLETLTEGKWIGDSTVHSFRWPRQSSSSSSSNEEGGGNDKKHRERFAPWSTSVAKVDLEWRGDFLPFCPKITTLRGGFGARADEPLEITSVSSDEDESMHACMHA